MADKQIYLFCEFGMSTSIMVNKMMDVVKAHKMPLQITAFPVSKADDVVNQEKPVAILLGPQVQFLFDKMDKQFTPQGIPVSVIDSAAYGMMDGEKVIKDTLALIKASKK